MADRDRSVSDLYITNRALARLDTIEPIFMVVFAIVEANIFGAKLNFEDLRIRRLNFASVHKNPAVTAVELRAILSFGVANKFHTICVLVMNLKITRDILRSR